MPVLRVQVVYQCITDINLTLCDRLQPCSHAQSSRLATSGRSEQCNKLSLPAFKIQILYSVIIQFGALFLLAAIVITLVKMFYG